MSDKIKNTLKISCSVIGSVIGAGFITGREIMSFFYGTNAYLTGIMLFVIFFTLIFVIFKADGKILNNMIDKSNFIVYFLSLMIIGAMLGATDSLAFEVMNISKNIPIFSILLLAVSTFICISGIDKINKANFIIVPAMILLLYFAIFYARFSGGTKNQNYRGGINFGVCICYGSMNIFLAQPFFSKIKKEKYEFSPFWVALTSAFFLALSVIFYLNVLNDGCMSCDIPLLYLIKDGKLLRYIVALVVFAGIFTTIIGAQYPLCRLPLPEKIQPFSIIIIALSCFLISRLGFFIIVDKLYKILSYISAIYFIIFICVFLVVFLKGVLRNTSKPLKCRAKTCLSLRDRVLKPDRRIR